jgi:hypothetical protein
MSTAVSVESRVGRVEVSDELITAYLVDGRVISVPLVWSWRLAEATPTQRANWMIIGDGQGVHWPDVDEDLSAEGMLHGIPAHRPATRSRSRGMTPPKSPPQPTSRARRQRVKKRSARSDRG